MYRIIRNTLIGHQRFPHLLRSHHALDRLPAPALPARTLPPSGGPGLRQRHLQDGLPLGDLSTHRQPLLILGVLLLGIAVVRGRGLPVGVGVLFIAKIYVIFQGAEDE